MNLVSQVGKLLSWYLNLCDYNDYLWSNNGREFNIELAQNVGRMYVQIFIIVYHWVPIGGGGGGGSWK